MINTTYLNSISSSLTRIIFNFELQSDFVIINDSWLILVHPIHRSNLKENKKNVLETLSRLQPKEEAIPGVAKASE